MNDAELLLGGAVRTGTRPRGFAAWKPQRATAAVLAQVQAVLEEYEDYLPLTLRQIFYRLVGAHDYPKTEDAYERLSNCLNRARRAGLIAMDVIRDDGGARAGGRGWDSPEQFVTSLRHQAEAFTLDRTLGQASALMVLCEAAGMAPQLAQTTDRFDVPVLSSGGFDSVTQQHRLAKEIAREDRPVQILHIGDHDPSGAHLYLSLTENVAAFADALGGEVTFLRLAVTPDQIRTYRLPTAPPKPTDKRAFAGQTCQAEAFAPDVLATILREAIESRIDLPTYEKVIAREKLERARLVKLLGRIAQ